MKNSVTKIKPLHTFLDEWIVHHVRIDPAVTTRLSGEGSIYQAYLDTCAEQGQIPLSLRIFAKRLEALLEFHFGVPSTKTRDQKGIIFPAVKVIDIDTLNHEISDTPNQLHTVPN